MSPSASPAESVTLAELESDPHAIETLLDRLPRLRLDPACMSAPRGLVFRKPLDLRVRWAPRAGW